MTRRTFFGGLAAQGVVRERAARKSNIVLISGESENRSEDTLPLLTQDLEARGWARCNVLVMSGPREVPGIEMLEDADLAVLYVSRLELPPAQMQYVRAHVQMKKPIVAIRSTLQGFNNWMEFGPQVLGAAFRHDYGPESTTSVSVARGARNQTVLNGVPDAFESRAPLYHVLPLSGSATQLLMGKPAGTSVRAERIENPVAWTRTEQGRRVFYTSLGGAEDFKVAAVRTLLVNAVAWGLNR